MSDDPTKPGNNDQPNLDASKGGIARAKKLSKEQRQEIARKAANSRWESASSLPEARWGSPDRPLRIGDIEIPCYVLSDGRRVLIQKGMKQALGISPGGSGGTGGDRLAKFASGRALNPFIGTKLLERTTSPIRFRLSTGSGAQRRTTAAYGYEATVLADLCEAVLAARSAGALLPQQTHIAEQAEILVRGFARVGIIALVDEATGYQDARARDALAKILEAFVSKELRKWVSTFPPDFYREMFRLNKWPFSPTSMRRPRMAGKYTDDIVYQRLAPGVRDELRRLTPRDHTGRLKNKLHQRLTDEVGHPRLREHLSAVVAIMKLSDTWDGFIRSLDRVLPRFGKTLPLPFDN